MEEFKDIAGYEGMYQVSNLGRVKSLARKDSRGHNLQEKIRKTPVSSCGYPSVKLCKDGKEILRTVHQLVAIAFLEHKPNGYKGLHVNHKNFNRQDNRLQNLEIVTARENTNQKHLKSSSRFVGVYWNKTSSKWMASIKINGKKKYLGLFKCETAASVAYQKALNTFNEN